MITLPSLTTGDKLTPYLKKFPLVRQMFLPHVCVDDSGSICSHGSRPIYAGTRAVPDIAIHDIIEWIIEKHTLGHPEFLYMYSIVHEKHQGQNPNMIWARFACHIPVNPTGDYQIDD